MKRSLWLLMLFLLAGHVPAASADSACEGRFVNPITDICWSCIFPLSLGSIKVSQGNVAALRQGTSGAKIQTSTETGNQHKYQTRVVSNANKVNLKFEEAKPVLEDQLAKSIANIL